MDGSRVDTDVHCDARVIAKNLISLIAYRGFTVLSGNENMRGIISQYEHRKYHFDHIEHVHRKNNIRKAQKYRNDEVYEQWVIAICVGI